MNKNAIGLRIKTDKDKIVAMYNNAIPLLTLAKKYNVGNYTMVRYLRAWGCKVHLREYKTKKVKFNRYKRKFSKDFLAHRAEMQEKYGHMIKYYKREDTKSEIDRVRSITKQKVTVI